MEFWEFLIQQEGDRSWLPLESPSVEILEGRYRIVARSSRSSTPTEVRVTHYAMHEDPPVQRARKRSSQTNPDGLIVILPFTRLEPGIWELSCTGDVMAEMMGQNWQYVVQLEVVPQEASLPDDWEPEWQLTASEPEPVPAEPVPAEPVLAEPVPAELVLAEPVLAESVPPEPQSLESSGLLDAPASVEPVPALASELVQLEPPELLQPEIPALNSVESAAVDLAVVAESPLDPETYPAPEPDPLESDRVAAEWTASKPLATEMHELLQQVEQVSQQIVDSAFSDLETFHSLDPLSHDGDLSLQSADLGLDAMAESAGWPQLRVILEQEVLILQRGESLSLTGRLDWAAEPTDPQPTVSELRVRLYDPQTSQILMDEVHPIDQRTPPFPFSGTVSLPEHYQTYLVLGELIFQGCGADQTPQVLATHLFHVTTDLHELIESIANDFPDGETLPPEARMPDIAEPLPAADWSRLSQSPSFQRWSQQPLPPQLHAHKSVKTHAALNLPSFGSVSAPTAATETEQDYEAAGAATAAEISHSAADLLPQPSQIAANGSTPQSGQPEPEPPPPASEIEPESAPEPESENPAKQTSPDAVQWVAAQPHPAEESADLFLEWTDIDKPVPIWQQRQRPLTRPVDASNAPEDVSFRALNLQDRFWTRLQSLAANPSASASAMTEATSTETALPEGVALELEAELADQEIVVDDDLPTPVQTAELSSLPLPEPEDLGPVLPEDEPIPTPRLQLANAEITAGQPVPLTVKLPTLEARVYIKLWLRDRQSRTLLGTPRWLIDFVPDGFGNQMARTEIIVPPGCLKVQFEAITVEIATQRESDKMTMTRPVVPPDLSPLSLDQLEI